MAKFLVISEYQNPPSRPSFIIITCTLYDIPNHYDDMYTTRINEFSHPSLTPNP